MTKVVIPTAISALVIAFMALGTGGGAGAGDSGEPTGTAESTFLEPTGEDPTPPKVTGVQYLTGDGEVIGDGPLRYGKNVVSFPRRADGTCDMPKNVGTFGVEGADFRGRVSISITTDDNCNVIAYKRDVE